MAEIAVKYMDRLEEIKDNIRESYQYFNDNAKRYHEFVRFVFNTALSDADVEKLQALGKPPIEFNILEAMISRLRGEFAKQEPSITVKAADGVRVEELTPEFIQTLNVIEAHLRYILSNVYNDNLQYNIYSDLLAGGYSAVEVFTDYINEMSFEQKIHVERVFDPTLCGWDSLARTSDKGDGRYCFKMVPHTLEDFEAEFGDSYTKDFKFDRNIEGFSWTYRNQNKKIVLVCDYYEKKQKRVKIVKLSNGHNIAKKHYDKLVELWNEQGFIEQAPQIVAERMTVIETICRYRVCDTAILDYVETDYKYLPIVFIDGNSVNMQDSEGGATYQFTRPFVFHAKGIQKLKNLSGQAIAAEIQNMIMHTWIAAVESIPEDYVDAYKNPQLASNILYNAFYKNDPNTPLPPPREVQRTPTPPIVENSFNGTDNTTQMILGSYDSILGMNSDAVSGKAIQQGALQSNAAAIPYLMGYIKGLNRIAMIIVDLIPKYYKTPRSLPIIKLDGKRGYQLINMPRNKDSIDLFYNPNSLSVKIEPGVNSVIQKQLALEGITSMMQASPVFAEFINVKGLEVILDNMDIRGIDSLKEKAAEFTQEIEQRKNQPPPPSDLDKSIQAELQKTQMILAQKSQEAQGDQSIDAAKVAIDKQLADIKYATLMSQIQEMDAKTIMEQQRVDAENARSAVDTAISIAKVKHDTELGAAKLNLDNAKRSLDAHLEVDKHHHTKTMDYLGVHMAQKEMQKAKQVGKDESK